MVKNPKRKTIAVVINTLNAERIFDKCLESVAWADEIVVCDMYSDDKTVEIAHKYGARVYFYERCGYVEPARNFANSKVQSDWLLVLDADELVTPELRDYLIKFSQNEEGYTALEIPRETYVLGQKLRCMYQSKLARFFKKGAMEYSTQIHQHPKLVEGKMTHIKKPINNAAIQHYHIESISSYAEKTNRYTNFEMDRFAANNKAFSLYTLITRPLFEFIKFYFLKGGILDGVAGLVICIMNAHYKFIQHAKLYEMKFKEKHPDLIY